MERLFALESDFIEECFIHSDGRKTYVLAAVVPNLEVFRIHGRRAGGEKQELASDDTWVYDEDEVKKVLKEEMQRIGKQFQLQYYEIPRGIVVEKTRFQDIEGVRTVTGKMLR